MTRALALGLCLVCGCSWIGMTPLPGNRLPQDPPPGDSPPRCTSSNTQPALDLVAAFPLGLLTGVIAYGAAGGEGLVESDEDDDENAQFAFAAATVATIGVFTASAFTGFAWSSRCRKAKEAFFEVREPEGPIPGSERGVCLPEGRCMPPLTCASGYCVRLR
jgi:hypothetical protein